MQDMKTTIGILVGAVLVFGAIIFFWAKNDKSVADPTVLIRPDSYTVGTKGAPVTIVEFADFQCPACAANAHIIEQFLEEYKDKVFYVYRHFPIRDDSNIAMNLAEAAGEQGKFFEVGYSFFEHNSEWAEKGTDPTELLTSYVKKIPGLDAAKVLAVLKDKKYDTKISRDQADGISLGVNSTPTFFFNGKKYVGVLSLETLRSMTDALLSAEKK